MSDKYSKKVALLAGIGAVLEFFDFSLYAIFSQEIAATFFAGIQNHTIKSFITIIIFSIAYIVRPFAGIILGIIGDLIGRKRLLLFTILTMGTCSLCMGLMPGYETWGLFSSFAFVFLRIVQGIALGGELPGAFVIVYESVKGRVGFQAGILFTFVSFGFLFSDVAGFALESVFGSYAWRLGFIIGGLLGFFGYYIRRSLHETPQFENIDNQKRHSFSSLVSTYGANLLAGICIVTLVAFGGVMLTLYMHNFIQSVMPNYNSSDISLILTPSVLSLCAFTFIFGYFTDKLGIAKIYIIGALSLAIVTAPVFYLIAKIATPTTIILASIVIMIFYSFVTSSFIFLLCDLFPTDVRLSGVGLSYNLAFAIVGGVAPILSTMIVAVTEYKFLGPSLMGVICSIIGLIGVFIYFKKGGFYKENKSVIVKL